MLYMATFTINILYTPNINIYIYIYTINGMGIEIEQRENHRFVCGFSSAMSHLTGGYIPMISPFNPQ